MRLLAHSFPLLLLLCLLLGGCADDTQPAESGGVLSAESDGQTVAGDDYFDDDDYLNDYSAIKIIPDPLEPWNRFWFGFNDVFIEYAARPLNKGYTFVVPSPARKGIKNFFHNLSTPVRFVNCLLQGKGQEAGVEFSSFFLNTLAGFGGFLDIASHYKPVVPATGEDLGQTLGAWGIGEGVYLVWPFLGPSNVRDTFGMAGDYVIGYYSNPLKYMDDGFDWTTTLALGALNVVNSLDDILKAYDTFKGIAIDPYTSMRDGFTQFRRGAVAK